MNLPRQEEPNVPRGLLSLLCEERPITVDEACDLRLLLFGNTVNSFPTGWTKQGFRFGSWPPYGLVQKQSGPCGVLAAVQACIIYELLFGFSRSLLDDGFLRPHPAEKKEALARALATILWQAGQEKKAVIVAKKSEHAVLDESATSGILEGDGFLECVKLKFFRSMDSLLQHLYNFIQDAIKEGGCVLFLYSIILTHGIDNIKKEMDDPDSQLIGDDGYCSQEVVNLILIGKAVPNLFNGDLELNSGGEETTLHRGIPEQSKIGLLSVYEYTNQITVGSFCKNPIYPIWLIISENHYTVLFGTSRGIFDVKQEKFDLFYYDGLWKSKREVTFTIDPAAKDPAAVPDKDSNLHVAVRCILTRWPLADIEVNSSDSLQSQKVEN